MADTDTRTNLRRIFSDILEIAVDAVNDDLSPDSCETWDSLTHVRIITAVEEEFGVSFDTSEIFDMDRFALFVDALDRARA